MTIKTKKVIIIIFVVLLLTAGVLAYLKIDSDKKEKQKEKEIQDKITEIKNHYSKYVKVNRETEIYNSSYQVIGKVNKDYSFELEDINIDENTKYFKVKDLDYLIKYEDVSKTDEKKIDDRYKRYVVFNENVITEEKVVLYQNENYALSLNVAIDTPIIIKDTDKYYIEYNNELFYVKKDDVKVKKSNNTKEKTRTNIRTFTYHAVYKEGEICKNDAICEPYDLFDSHMKYLYDNNFLTLKMEELEMFLDKKINIPLNTIVLTLDDGNLAKNAIEILDKYKLYATYFIITGRYDSYKLESNYVAFESHSDNLHNNYKCPGGEQGGQLLCEKKENVLADLKTSQEKLNGSAYFSYPFFDWNERAKSLLKEAGFHLAFIGQWTEDGYSTFTTDRMMIRRKTIFAADSLETFKSYLK